MEPIGKKRWAIAEGYIPQGSTAPDETLVSHETACILNASEEAANISVTVFFIDDEPMTYELTVEAKRTHHLRFDKLKPHIPRAKEYASVIESDVPIVVQHTRIDTRQSENALLSTTAYGES